MNTASANVTPTRWLCAYLTIAAITLVPIGAAEALDSLPRLALSLNGRSILAEVADTDAARAQGLSGRRALAADSGMLFVFDTPGRYAMWMRDTPIALSGAFLDESGVIINIADMQPNTLTRHTAARPAKYVLEMNLGWFTEAGVTPGVRVEGLVATLPVR